MEGYFDMIKNYGPQLYKNYESMYYMDMSKAKPLKRKGLVKRPDEPSRISSTVPRDLMQEYFASVREMRNKLNDTT